MLMRKPRARALAVPPAAMACALALGVSLLAVLPRTARATPPQPPLELRLVLLEPPVPGRAVPFAVEITPGIPAARLEVAISPPRDVALVRGSARATRRDVAPGRLLRFDGSLAVPPGRRHHVYVRAELVTAGGRRYTRGEHLVVLAGPLLVPDPVARTVSDGRGGTLVEYEAGAGSRPGGKR
jgi:hypothetical protein